MKSIEDTESLAWDKTTRTDVLGYYKDIFPIDLTTSDRGSRMTDGAITAMNKLSASMIGHQAATLKKQNEKNYTNFKAWHQLPRLQQQVILLGGVEEDGTVPEETTE